MIGREEVTEAPVTGRVGDLYPHALVIGVQKIRRGRHADLPLLPSASSRWGPQPCHKVRERCGWEDWQDSLQMRQCRLRKWALPRQTNSDTMTQASGFRSRPCYSLSGEHALHFLRQPCFLKLSVVSSRDPAPCKRITGGYFLFLQKSLG